jgi:ParB family chromosome partitioning protein
MSETTIPLNKMLVWSGNVRKTGAADGIAELAASIAAHGLLQSLVVRKASRSRYAVIAGGRRYAALSRLAAEGSIDAAYPVPCRVLSGDADLTEISLAENVVRAPMHPADQFEAFRHLIDNGASAADVAARFGTSEAIVMQRMKLGRVSPALLALYREGAMSLDQVKAFTVSDDHAAQERVWAELPGYARHAGSIRQALTAGEIPASDKRVRLVTLDAYEAAGGAVRRDLFDERNDGYVMDPALLDRLVDEKLSATLAEVTAEGWKWTEIQPDFDWQARQAFKQAHPQAADLPAGDAAELKALTEEAEAIGDMADDEDDLPPDAAERLSEINARLDQLTDRQETFSEEQRAIAGAVISLRHDGTVSVERGLVRPGDIPAAVTDKASRDKAAKPPALPASLVEELTQHRTAALQVELARQPEIALAAVAHAMCLEVFYGYGPDSSLDIRTAAPRLGPVSESEAKDALISERDRWGDKLPGDTAALWDWCLEQDQENLLDLLAVAAAHSVNAVRHKGETTNSRLQHADQLATALNLDMTDWYMPTADNLFGRISKTLTLDAIAEARQQPNAIAWAKLKKPELAALAERHMAGTGWLPEPLRTFAPDNGQTAASIASGD